VLRGEGGSDGAEGHLVKTGEVEKHLKKQGDAIAKSQKIKANQEQLKKGINGLKSVKTLNRGRGG